MIVVVSDNGASGEGGPNGSVNEMKFANGVPDDLAEPGDDRRARRHEDVQPLPERLGDGVQHAVQDVEALRVQRRHVRPVHHLVAGRARRPAARSATSTTTRSTSSRRSSTCSASSRPRRSRATPSRRFDGVSMRDSFDDADGRRRTGRRSSTRCSARARSGTRAGRPSRPIRRSPAGATSTTTSGSSTTPTSTASELHNLAAEQPDKLRELVNIWFSEAGANGAFPLDDRSPVEILITPRPQLTAAAEPLRVLPGRRRGARVAGGQHAEPLVRDRRARRHPGAGSRGRALRARLAVRRPRALRQGQPAPLRQQLRRHRRSRWSSAPRTSRPART